MKRWLVSGLLLAASGCVSTPQPVPGQGDDRDKIVLYRDTWGVPHIYAPTVEGGLFAQGYSQAQDRPTQLLLNLKIAMGELASVAGAEQIPSDLLARMFDHLGNGERTVASMDAQTRGRIQAFVDGINRFYADSPDKRPPWWGDRQVSPAMIDAFGRLFLYNWSIDEALQDLRRGGIEPDFVTSTRGSNQWAVAPDRSASGNALLLIDPHLAWFGPSRFWEMRVHAGEWQGSGVGLAGSPWIGLGHNANLAWAMTTGGPDTADVFAVEMHPQDPGRYRYGDEWRMFTTREVTLQVRGQPDQQHGLSFTHHGPVIARKDGVAYAAKIPYDHTVDRNTAWEILNFAEDYRAVQQAAATLAFFPQNIMAADTKGNIYYQRVGRVPVRSTDIDWSRPVDGSDPEVHWHGFHPSSDHLEMLNPESGYMQNCNIPPDAMIAGGAFNPSDYPNYLYAGPGHGETPSGWSNQRGSRALELLSADDAVTVEEALAYAVDVKPFGVERWLAAFEEATPAPDEDEQVLLAWDRQLTRFSNGALRYAFWRFALHEHPLGPGLREKIDDHYAIVERRAAQSFSLTDAERQAIRSTFAQAMDTLRSGPGIDATYGDVFRVGRDDVSWPVGGGGGEQYGLTTLRNMNYSPANRQGQRMGVAGQTSTQVVELASPIRSWLFLPVGQSDDPQSPHYTDQAEGPFQQRALKPSWWLPQDLQGHIRSRQVLTR